MGLHHSHVYTFKRGNVFNEAIQHVIWQRNPK